jgi:hypothetical protein
MRDAYKLDTLPLLAAAGAVVAAVVLLASLNVAVRPRLLTVDGGHAERATGFAIRDETVVTVAHAIEGSVHVDGRPATVIRRDDQADLALLHVPGLKAPTLPIAGTHTLTAHVDGALRDVIVVRKDVRPGDSGTPVIEHGRVVGVIFARSATRPHTAYAVAGAALRQITASSGTRRAAMRTPASVSSG